MPFLDRMVYIQDAGKVVFCRAATAGNELLLLLVWLLRRYCLGFKLVSCGQVPLELQGQFFSISIFGLQGAFTSGPASVSDIATHVPKSSLEADLMQEMTAAALRSSARQARVWLSAVKAGFPGTGVFGEVRAQSGTLTQSQHQLCILSDVQN